MDDVEQQVNNYIRETKLPENVSTDINRFSFGSFPIFNISLFSKEGTDLQTLLDKEIIPELNKIEGINSVSVGGLEEDLLQITVDKKKALGYGLSLSDIKEQINNKILSFPAGNLQGSDIQVPVRVQEKVETINQLKDLVLYFKV